MAIIRYAKGPVVYLYDPDNLKTKKKQLLWGDWLRIGDDLNENWSKIKWGSENLAIKKKDYQEERILEMIFLDVGQGDGCILTTPLMNSKEKIIIIDAGVGDNMKNYLKYRFRDFKKKSPLTLQLSLILTKTIILAFKKYSKMNKYHLKMFIITVYLKEKVIIF